MEDKNCINCKYWNRDKVDAILPGELPVNVFQVETMITLPIIHSGGTIDVTGNICTNKEIEEGDVTHTDEGILFMEIPIVKLYKKEQQQIVVAESSICHKFESI